MATSEFVDTADYISADQYNKMLNDIKTAAGNRAMTKYLGTPPPLRALALQ